MMWVTISLLPRSRLDEQAVLRKLTRDRAIIENLWLIATGEAAPAAKLMSKHKSGEQAVHQTITSF